MVLKVLGNNRKAKENMMSRILVVAGIIGMMFYSWSAFGIIVTVTETEIYTIASDSNSRTARCGDEAISDIIYLRVGVNADAASDLGLPSGTTGYVQRFLLDTLGFSSPPHDGSGNGYSRREAHLYLRRKCTYRRDKDSTTGAIVSQSLIDSKYYIDYTHPRYSESCTSHAGI
ncbi:hypothetical protein [Victivallis sp. Marseille-Q1083]|uniref:hypothetical protein n=1 Tax=Victivallis sp. Marseille-Q1083 TaxID=2717288 RepID=UPI00158C3033|nr:hypothetical protein [Victivallis sp. Marseille-Q1083]